MNACREKLIQVNVAVQGFKVLSSLCSFVINSISNSLSDLNDFFDISSLAFEVKDVTSSWLRRSRRAKEQSTLKYSLLS